MTQELRYALRRLARQGGATLIAIVTLACAIGTATATWTLVSATILHPIPGASTGGWHVLHVDRDGGVAFDFTYPALRFAEESGAFERVEARWSTLEHLRLSRGGASSGVGAAFVTHGLLPGLDVPVRLGRAFTAAEDRRGAAPVAILTDRGWREAFAADPSVVGETVGIGRAAVTIIGVLGPGFRGLGPTDVPDLYLPLHTIGDVSSPLTNFYAEDGHVSSPTAGLRVFGRLADGAESGTGGAPAVGRGVQHAGARRSAGGSRDPHRPDTAGRRGARRRDARRPRHVRGRAGGDRRPAPRRRLRGGRAAAVRADRGAPHRVRDPPRAGRIGRAPGLRPGARSGDRRRRGRPRRTARRLVGAARRPRVRPPGRRGRVGARRRPRRAGDGRRALPPACARSRPSPAWPRCTPPCARRPPTCSRRRPPCGRGDAAGSATACSRPRWRWLSSS